MNPKDLRVELNKMMKEKVYDRQEQIRTEMVNAKKLIQAMQRGSSKNVFENK